MGCSDSKTTPSGSLEDNRHVPAEGPNYPPPYVPERNKAEVFDRHVNTYLQNKVEKVPLGIDNSYTSLLKYLSEGVTKEMHHVTAIYLWMKSQDYNDPDLDLERPVDTPRAYMKWIKEGTGDLTSFFTIMCRKSSIPCRIITGLGKDNDYYMGYPDKKMYTRWCAVYVDEEWRLVHVEWCIPLDRDSNQNSSQTETSDFFFFTDPEDFATFCLPENFRWQLLNQAYSRKEFLNLPLMRPLFFTMDMAIIQPKTGNIRTHSGKTEIEITFPKKLMDSVCVSFLLSYNDETENSEGPVTIPTSLEKYVFMNRKPSRFIFEIHLPVPGKYLFDIYGDSVEVDGHKKDLRVLERLCQFRISSDRQFQQGELEPLPESPDIGWGPGPVCRHLGLIPMTHFDSCLFIRPGEVRDLKFRLTKSLDVLCQLTHNYLPIYQLVEQVECTQTDGQLNVRVQIPEEGQYALKIYCREAGTKEFDEACVFLIRQRERGRLPEKHRDKMLRTRLEHHLNNHTSEKELEDALSVFNCYNVPDNGERKRTQEKLKQYWEIKRELNGATKGRNQRVIRKWVEKARNSKFEADLFEDIQKAENLDENLGKLKGNTHPIARMDPHTMIEIRNYKRPPKIVHDVMMSTYLLLGEKRYDVEEWEGIQYLMGKHGKDNLQKRIVARSPEDVHIEIAEEADTVIQPYSMQKCRGVSTGIGTFYRWNKQFINDVRRRDMNEKEMKELAQQLSGRETFRDADSTTPSRDTTGRENVTFRGRGDPIDEEVEEPFALDQSAESTVEETPRRKFYMTALKPTEKSQPSAISYAGWKPSD